MAQEKRNYVITIELEVTATSEKEALKYVVEDVNELHKDGTLDYKAKVSE